MAENHPLWKKPAPQRAHETQAEPLIAETKREDNQRSLRVLVADDNRYGANALAQLLTSWGYQVRVVYDGPAALQSAQTHPPDVALIDLGLPGMDGYQVALHLRQQAQLKRGKLIAITGFDWPGAPRRSQAYGF